MTRDDALALADKILALINSRPSTPRREEIASLIEAHQEAPDALSPRFLAGPRYSFEPIFKGEMGQMEIEPIPPTTRTPADAWGCESLCLREERNEETGEVKTFLEGRWPDRVAMATDVFKQVAGEAEHLKHIRIKGDQIHIQVANGEALYEIVGFVDRGDAVALRRLTSTRRG